MPDLKDSKYSQIIKKVGQIARLQIEDEYNAVSATEVKGKDSAANAEAALAAVNKSLGELTAVLQLLDIAVKTANSDVKLINVNTLETKLNTLTATKP